MADWKIIRSEPPESTRRDFLGKAIAVLGCFIGGAIGVPAVGHIISPALKPPDRPLIPVGSVDQFEVGKPQKVDFVYYKKDGWVEERTSGSAWVVRTADTNFTVFDPRCTHLGCPYSWNADRGQFLCPCHDGVFTIDGKVVSGPPPRPLDRFEHTVDADKLFIKEVASRA